MKLLAERENDGILVRLFWDDRAEPGHDVILRYRDGRSGHAFSARPPREKALHAFYHPNAYAPAEIPEAA
ncbi:MAG: hypothetical protein ACRDOS_04705 [Gaiellaceae bacterium]|jgi:hypothetical protein